LLEVIVVRRKKWEDPNSGKKILAPTKHWLRQNNGADRNIRVNRNYWRQQNIGVDKMLALTKYSH
jgi:hypothetical protein